jgi:hypothetical protein
MPTKPKPRRSKKGWLTPGRRNTIVTIVLIALLISAVRAFYWTGPIFANSLDESGYFVMISQTAIYNRSFNFTQYNVADFGNVSVYPFTPPNVHQFYIGLLYPEIFLMKVFGYSTSLAIWYLIFNSVVEGVAIFLILDLIFSRRAAVIGGVLLAFFPIDVLFSTHLQPLVPMVAMMAVSIYLFLLADRRSSEKKRFVLPLYLLCGVFLGFAFWVNPLATVEIAFLSLIFIYRIARGGHALRDLSRYAIVLVGAFAVYSVGGVMFLLQTGRFFLYPELYHIFFLWQVQNQPYIITHVIGNIFFKYTFGIWYFYLPIIFNLPLHFYMPVLRYFSIMTYVFIIACLVLLLKRNRWLGFFLLLFAVGFAFIELLPTGISFQGGNVYVYITNMSSYLATILTIPMIILIAMFLDTLMKSRRRYLVYMSFAILVAILVVDIVDLNQDTAFYSSTTFTVHALAGYVTAHPYNNYYATGGIAFETSVYTNFKYNIYAIGCNANVLYSTQNALVVIGGTVNMDLDPAVVQQFDTCISDNLTGFSTIYTVNNPYSGYIGQGGAPQLRILQRNST